MALPIVLVRVRAVVMRIDLRNVIRWCSYFC